MSHRERLALLLVVAVLVFSVPIWLVFHQSVTGTLSQHRLFVVVVLVFCITPLYPLYRRAKMHPKAAVAPILLTGALVCIAISAVANFVFHLNAPWVGIVDDLRTGLLLSACLLFVWNGIARRSN